MKAKKIVSLLLALGISTSMFAGCNSKPSNDSSKPDSSAGEVKIENFNPTGYPIVNDKITIKALGMKDPGGAEWADLWLFKELERITNIAFEFELVESTSFAEKKNLALATGTYPDVILRDHSKIMDEETYGPQGIFQDLSDMIDKYAPNLKDLMNTEPDVKPSITSLDGSIYGLPYFCRTATRNPHLAFLNGTWLDNLGLKEPKTTDELYEVLKAFKEKDANGNGNPNDEIPWNNKYKDSSFDAFLKTAFTGTVGDMFDVIDGKVVLIPTVKGYKEMLEWSNKAYKEGLFDPEIFVQDTQQFQAKNKTGNVGFFNSTPTIFPQDSKDRYITLEPITSPTNDKKVCLNDQVVYTSALVITDKCKNPEAVIRYFDILYADEKNAVEGISGTTPFVGQENVHFKYTNDGKNYELLDPIKTLTDINNTVSVNMQLPSRLDFLAAPSNSPLLQLKVNEVWAKQYPYVRAGYPVNARATAEENGKISIIEKDMKTYINSMVAKFVTGEVPVSDYDKFVAELGKIGSKDILEIKQKSYDRWVASSK